MEKRKVTGQKYLNLKEGEQNVPTATFNRPTVMTRNFCDTMGGEMLATMLAAQSLKMILKDKLKNSGTDYLRVIEMVDEKGDVYNKFWAIDDGSYVTFLMPEDY